MYNICGFVIKRTFICNYYECILLHSLHALILTLLIYYLRLWGGVFFNFSSKRCFSFKSCSINCQAVSVCLCVPLLLPLSHIYNPSSSDEGLMKELFHLMITILFVFLWVWEKKERKNIILPRYGYLFYLWKLSWLISSFHCSFWQ